MHLQSTFAAFCVVATFVLHIMVNVPATAAAATTVRPYKFGFNIAEQQHRSEQRDEKGIVMGEFGFITADGIYHVTVYATDEEGKFRILAMRSYPYETPPKTINMVVTPKELKVQSPPATSRPAVAAAAPRKPAPKAAPSLPKYNFHKQGCSGCFLEKTLVEPPRPAEPEVKANIRPLSQSLPSIASSSSGGGGSGSAGGNLLPQGTLVSEKFAKAALGQVLHEAQASELHSQNAPTAARKGAGGNTSTSTHQGTSTRTSTSTSTSTRTNTNTKHNAQTPVSKSGSSSPSAGVGRAAATAGAARPSTAAGKSGAFPATSGAASSKAGGGGGNSAAGAAKNIPSKSSGSSGKPLAKSGTSGGGGGGFAGKVGGGGSGGSSGGNAAAAPRALGGKQASGPLSIDLRTNVAGGGKTGSVGGSGSGRSAGGTHGGAGGASAGGGGGDLYRFKYLLDYHGHTETGSHNGNKQGNYHAIGDDNVERTIEYVANEFGYQPRINWKRVDAPKTKENTLKEYEFVWFDKP